MGPGPGSPLNATDIGVIKDIWRLPEEKLLPVFGVCLGLQSLAVEYGGTLQRLPVVKHGQVSAIHHTGVDIFKNVREVEAVRYHSLHVTVKDNLQLEELAWADDKENGRVVMALKHKIRPFWAVQYHPESVRTAGGGLEVMENFCRLASDWNCRARRNIPCWDQNAEEFFGPSWPGLCISPFPPLQSPSVSRFRMVITNSLLLPDLTSTSVAELFGATTENEPFVLLDSPAQPGRYCIIGVCSPASPRVQYHNGDPYVTIIENSRRSRHSLNDGDVWSWTSKFMGDFLAKGGDKSIPFWGGLVGYISYELACNTVDPNSSRIIWNNSPRTHPDINLILIERSVVLDNVTGRVFVQSIVPQDETWVTDTVSSLRDLTSCGRSSASRIPHSTHPTLHLPSKSSYISKINSAKEHLAVGNSYELCLTAQSRITFSSATNQNRRDTGSSSSWERFKTLRKRNPAPYSAYLRLHPTTVLSSSPERFLSNSRPPESVFQLRPIKGTLRKSSCTSRSGAEKALQGSAKEVAENLMIVDLIRHDLHGVVGEDVKVTQFCEVEEYETVWQMVSVIEGKPHKAHLSRLDMRQDLGWNVLRQSLPPGVYDEEFKRI